MAVAVDDQRDAGGNRAAGQRAVHVQMPRRAVDLHRRAGFGRRGEQPVEIQLVAAANARGERLAGCVMTLTSG